MNDGDWINQLTVHNLDNEDKPDIICYNGSIFLHSTYTIRMIAYELLVKNPRYNYYEYYERFIDWNTFRTS